MATLSSSDAAHFLRRVGFGGTPAEVATYTGLTRDAAVALAMDFTAAPTVVPPADLANENQWWAHSNAIDWWLHRMADTTHPLQEKIALFWHNHFCTAQSTISNMVDMFTQNQLFRPAGPGNATGLGLGSFRDLAREVSLGGAMLVYLNNDTNVKGREQENFARELMELFTVGVGHYTESDVVAMAKAWTGHNVVGWVPAGYYDTTYTFFPTRHDTTNKTLFGGGTSTQYGAQPRNWNALETIDELVFGIKQADTARYVARKMYRYFISDSPSDAAVQQLADAWIAGSMSIASLVQATLLHADFWAPAARYAIVRSPVEFIVASLRRTGYRFEANSAEGRNYIEGMGQVPFDPPNVAGWKMNGYWLSTATAWARGGYASWLRWKVTDTGDLASLLPTLTAGTNGRVALTATDAINTLFDLLGIVEPSAATRSRFEAWYTAANTSTNGWSIRGNALMLGLLSPDFQLA
jgi:uncharacterized protein (DUF1800 family)